MPESRNYLDIFPPIRSCNGTDTAIRLFGEGLCAGPMAILNMVLSSDGGFDLDDIDRTALVAVSTDNNINGKSHLSMSMEKILCLYGVKEAESGLKRERLLPYGCRSHKPMGILDVYPWPPLYRA